MRSMLITVGAALLATTLVAAFTVRTLGAPAADPGMVGWFVNLWHRIARKPNALPPTLRANDGGWPPIRGNWPDPPDRRRSKRRYGLDYPPVPPPPPPPEPPKEKL